MEKKSLLGNFLYRQEHDQLKVPVQKKEIKRIAPPQDFESQEKLLEEFVEWALTTKATNPNDFPLSRRISPFKFFRLRFVCPEFEDMIELGRVAIAGNLERDPLVSPSHTSSKIRYLDKEYGDWVTAQVSKAIAQRSENREFTIIDADYATHRKE